ncbi:hypothetical protein LSTR_LSTR007446 [Laodelphax striatellus]|uniref:DUF4797 domain-containing protein n=1 Tax=Laodelphax striatellus TaxID=195883 RepID=A0A482X3Q3_LAOST|nr:hypothetical protein LSTR_LSTR007446 [Laodelphax striatellus]
MNNNINERNSSFSTPVLLVSVTSPSRGSSPTRDLRGIHLFRAISRKISRGHHHHRSRHCDNSAYAESYSSTDSEHSSDSGSGSGSGHNSPDSMRSDSSASTLRKVFQSLSIGNSNERRNSDTSTTSHKKSTNNQPKRILRQPVTYDYKRGISGLPTIRVPRNSNCCTYQFSPR